uniref:Uncharacterized protein n=1 Tax=Vitis vinifera TaxID=29760 RepID=A5AW73_VITVI|nr:hypothetical protein VITISV_041887 [Vitis vinifera]
MEGLQRVPRKSQKEQMNMGSEDINEDLFDLEDKDFGEEINSRMNITNISSGGSNRGGSDEMVVQNQRSGKMNQTTINDAYKNEAREKAYMFITRWMYKATIPFNAVTYPSFQPMIEVIGQCGVGMNGSTLHEVSGPLVHVLHLVDGEKKAYVGYIYGGMNRAKDTIVRSFNGNEEKYKEIFNIIDKRLTRDPTKQEKVVAEVSLYTNAQRLFGNELAVRTMKTRAPGCEWNWSIFENIHSKRRNRLDHQRFNDLVYIKYNRDLKRRYKERNTIDPISFKDIDDSNEWLIGMMEDEDSHGDAQDDFVFNDNNLTWGDVARATGAEEARFGTRVRARASLSIIPPTKGIASSSRTLSCHSLIDEDEDGDMVDSTDKEDGESYKCDDGNDDDDDFVDLEDE